MPRPPEPTPEPTPDLAAVSRSPSPPSAGDGTAASWRLVRWWRARGRWQRRGLIALPTTILVYTLLGFFGVPLLVKHVVVPQIGKRMTGSIALHRIEFNPYTFRVLLEGLELKDERARRAVAFERFETNFELWRSIFKAGLHFQGTAVVEPFLGLHTDEAGRLNLAGLFKPDPQPKEQEPLKKFPHFVIDSLAIEDGEVLVEDLSLPEPFLTVLGGLNLTFDTIDTSPEHLNPTHLVATTDTGARIEWTGDFKLDPLSSKGTVTATDLAMPKFMPYALRYVDARVDEGTLNFTLEYEFVPVREPRLAVLGFPSIVVDQLKVSQHGEPLAALPRLEVLGVKVDGMRRELVAEAIRLQDGFLLARRRADGVINLAALVRAPEDSAAAPNPTPTNPAPAGVAATGDRIDPADIDYPIEQLLTALSYLIEDIAGPWDIAIEELTIDNQGIDVEDLAVAPAVRVPLRETTLRAGPIRSAERYLVPYTARTRLQERAQLHLEGKLGALDGTLDTSVEAEDIELATGAPYLSLVLADILETPTLRSGHASIDLRIVADIDSPEGAVVELSGPMQLREAQLVRAADQANLFTAASAVVDGQGRAVTREDGSLEASWSGTVSAEALHSGESLMRSLQLGEGDLTLAEASSTMSLTTASEGAGKLTGGWEGRVDLRGIAGAGLALSGPVDLEAASIRLEGKADAAVEPNRPLKAEWVGQIELVEGKVGLRTALLEAKVGSLLLDGSAKADEPSRDGQRFVQSLVWQGSISTQRAEAAFEEVLRASIETLALDGELHTLVGQDAVAEWSGTLTSRNLHATGQDWTSEVGDVTVDGRAQVDQAASQPLRWEGTLSAASLRANIAEAGGLESKGRSLSLQGVLTGESEKFDAWAWRGSLQLLGPEVRASDLEGPAAVSAEAVRVEGLTRLDGRAAGSFGHQGPLEITGAQIRAEQVASGLDAGARSLRVDGGLAVEDLRERPRTSWRGTVAAAEASLRTAGGADADLRIAEIGAEGEMAIEPGPAGPMSWNGTAALASVAGSAAGASVGLGAAKAVGTLEIARGDNAAIDWNGTTTATDARHGDPSGESSVAAAAITHQGAVRLVQGPTPDLLATGTLGIEGTIAALGIAKAEVPRIAAEGIDLRRSAGTLALSSLAIESPRLTADVTTAPPEAADSPAKAAAPSEGTRKLTAAERGEALADALPFRVALGTFALSDGRIELQDRSDPQAPSSVIDEIRVQLVNVATDGSAMSDLDAAARIQGSGRFAAAGRANIFENPPSGDIKVSLENVPLPPYSGLSGRFVGFRIDSGRLNVDVPVTVDAGKVKGQLDFLMDRMKLGEKVKSPDAPNIPFDLGLALLRDANDQIKGGVPFSGDMANPDFSFGGLIWQAVLSLFGKIVTAPFALIASAFAGGQDLDLTFVAFEPGSAKLDGTALAKLDVLAKGLEERPALRLEIEGQFSRAADIAAIRPMLLREEAKRRLQSSFPNIQVVPDDVYRQIVLSKHAELPPAQQAPRQSNGDAPLFEQVERTVLATMEVTDQMLKDLATQRAQAIREMLVTEKRIAPERVEAMVSEADAAEPRAEFRLE